MTNIKTKKAGSAVMRTTAKSDNGSRDIQPRKHELPDFSPKDARLVEKAVKMYRKEQDRMAKVEKEIQDKAMKALTKLYGNSPIRLDIPAQTLGWELPDEKTICHLCLKEGKLAPFHDTGGTLRRHIIAKHDWVLDSLGTVEL